MRNACRTALSLALILLPIVPTYSQNYPNNLSMDSISPSRDSLFFSEVRARMDVLRREQKRPTVGLVLSGGGAKGAAEVGALMYIEEMGIPIDLVCGTSIGGLLGSLYAMGYDSADMKELFTGQDWNYMLSDKVNEKFLPYKNKMHRAKFLIRVPFRDSDEVFEDEGDSFLNSLPTGYAYGFNVNNLISSLTIGYQDSTSFSRFPTPFVCVAADMVSSKAKNWGDGSIKTAMRSTMSIPGLFAPVRHDGMILVDGGVRNNFPADLAREMGADFIIGIDLSDERLRYEDFKNVGNIFSEFTTMLGTDSFNKNIHIPDILIRPDMKEYNMLSFNNEDIDDMIVRGYDAAKNASKELLELKHNLGDKEYKREGRKAVNLAKTEVRIASIEFEGLNEDESEMMFKMLDFQAGDFIDKERIDETIARMQGTGAFSELSYSLYGEESPYKLVFHCKTAPTHLLSLGFRMDTEEWASLLFELGINTNKLTGSNFNIAAKIGQNFKLDAHYSVLDIPWLPRLNFDFSISKYGGLLGTYHNPEQYHASYWTHSEKIYLTDVRWMKFNFKAGIKNQDNNVSENSYLGSIISSSLSKDALRGDYVGLFASGDFYTMDNYYYASSGSHIKLRANYDFMKMGQLNYSPVITISLDSRFAIALNEKFALIPELYVRNVISTGSKLDLSILHANFIGGHLPGRYMETQIPFFGVNNVLMMDEFVSVANLGIRYNPFKKAFLSLRGGLVNSSDNFNEMLGSITPEIYAIGMEAAYNFAAGPVKLDIHWSNLTGWGLYASFGFDF